MGIPRDRSLTRRPPQLASGNQPLQKGAAWKQTPLPHFAHGPQINIVKKYATHYRCIPPGSTDRSDTSSQGGRPYRALDSSHSGGYCPGYLAGEVVGSGEQWHWEHSGRADADHCTRCHVR